jgi:hypothetical protein
MIHRNLDTNHDWLFGKGKESFLFDDNAVGMNIKTRVLSFFNDCFFDTDAGIDWFNLLDIGKKNHLEQAIRATVLQSYGVTALLELDIVENNRKLLIQYVIETIFNTTYTDKLEV